MRNTVESIATMTELNTATKTCKRWWIIIICFQEKPPVNWQKNYIHICIYIIIIYDGNAAAVGERERGWNEKTVRWSADVKRYGQWWRRKYHKGIIYICIYIYMYTFKYVPGIKRVLSIPPTWSFFLPMRTYVCVCVRLYGAYAHAHAAVLYGKRAAPVARLLDVQTQ